jgi:ubiquinone/menaquinone biosynthesis C-methylase UbiE
MTADVKDKLVKNWTDSSANYSALVGEELRGFKRTAWAALIAENAGGAPPLRALDVGTGPGFFAIILAHVGHEVTAVDCVEAMLDEARRNAQGLGVEFVLADSQKLPFPDNSFDLITSRNVAWTIIDAEAAYREWLRVLAPGGRAIVFDGNWNRRLSDAGFQAAYEKDLAEYRSRWPDKEIHEFTPEMLEFRRRLPQCSRARPQWDLGALLEAGFASVSVEADVGPRIYEESELVLNRSTPMFMIAAVKGRRQARGLASL